MAKSAGGKKKSISISTEGVSTEQLTKHAVGYEDVDIGGRYKRQRVLTQTIFDVMLIHEFISQPGHEAAHQFVEDFGQAGGVPRSGSLDSESHTPGHLVSAAMGERRMGFSDPYRAMRDGAKHPDVEFFLSIASTAHDYQSKIGYLRAVGKRCAGPLRALSRYYGTDGRTDPRDILRRQIGVPPKSRGR